MAAFGAIKDRGPIEHAGGQNFSQNMTMRRDVSPQIPGQEAFFETQRAAYGPYPRLEASAPPATGPAGTTSGTSTELHILTLDPEPQYVVHAHYYRTCYRRPRCSKPHHGRPRCSKPHLCPCRLSNYRRDCLCCRCSRPRTRPCS